jgi:hypothetical protein
MKFDESMLSGYIDGELSAEELQVVERQLETSPADRALLERLTLLHRQLRALPEEIFSTDPVDQVRARLDAQRRAELQVEQIDPFLATGDPPATKRQTRQWLLLLTLAASVLLITGLWQWQPVAPLATNLSSTSEPMRESPSVNMQLDAPGPRDRQDVGGQDVGGQDVGGRGVGGQASGETANGAAAPEALLMQPSVEMQSAAAPVREMASGKMLALDSSIGSLDGVTPTPSDTSMSQPTLFFRFDAGDDSQPADAAPLETAEASFDMGRAIVIEVPEGFTDDALRMLGDWMRDSAGDGSTDAALAAAETKVAPPETADPTTRASVARDVDFAAPETNARLLAELDAALQQKLSSGNTDSVAVRVRASPQRLAGLIQSMQGWSRQTDPSVSAVPEMRLGELVQGRDDASQPDDQVALRFQPNRSLDRLGGQRPGWSANPDGSGLKAVGQQAAASVRDGEIWIVIQPSVD